MRKNKSSTTKVVQKPALAFRQKKSVNLANDEWVVFTIDKILISKIYDQASKNAESETIEDFIIWKNRKIPVFKVPFYVVEFLKKNKSTHPDYISFHRRKRAGSTSCSKGNWSMWKEGKTTPNNFLKKVFDNWEKVRM